MIAGMVGTIAGSPTPLTPRWTDRIRILDDDRIDAWHIERGWQNIFGKARRGGPPIGQLVVFHQRLPERLHGSALDLPLHALRIDGPPDIVRRPDSKDLHLACYSVDFDLGDLGTEYIGLPGSA